MKYKLLLGGGGHINVLDCSQASCLVVLFLFPFILFFYTHIYTYMYTTLINVYTKYQITCNFDTNAGGIK